MDSAATGRSSGAAPSWLVAQFPAPLGALPLRAFANRSVKGL